MARCRVTHGRVASNCGHDKGPGRLVPGPCVDARSALDIQEAVLVCLGQAAGHTDLTAGDLDGVQLGKISLRLGTAMSYRSSSFSTTILVRCATRAHGDNPTRLPRTLRVWHIARAGAPAILVTDWELGTLP